MCGGATRGRCAAMAPISSTRCACWCPAIGNLYGQARSTHARAMARSTWRSPDREAVRGLSSPRCDPPNTSSTRHTYSVFGGVYASYFKGNDVQLDTPSHTEDFPGYRYLHERRQLPTFTMTDAYTRILSALADCVRTNAPEPIPPAAYLETLQLTDRAVTKAQSEGSR